MIIYNQIDYIIFDKNKNRPLLNHDPTEEEKIRSYTCCRKNRNNLDLMTPSKNLKIASNKFDTKHFTQSEDAQDSQNEQIIQEIKSNLHPENTNTIKYE